MRTRWPSWLLLAIVPVAVGFVIGCSAESPSAPSLTSATPTVLRQGTLSIEQTFTADLETGAVGVGESGADIWFEAKTADERYLTPQNGARIMIAGSEAPGFARCVAAGGGLVSLPMPSLTPGLYLCGVTKHGHIAQLRIEQAPGPSPVAFTAGAPRPTLVLSFTTFNN